LQPHYGPGVNSASKQKEVPGIFLRIKDKGWLMRNGENIIVNYPNV
jgi:hypothetical protein